MAKQNPSIDRGQSKSSTYKEPRICILIGECDIDRLCNPKKYRKSQSKKIKNDE